MRACGHPRDRGRPGVLSHGLPYTGVIAPQCVVMSTLRPAIAVAMLVALALSAALAAAPAHAQSALCAYRSVRLLVGFPPGGGTDFFARLLAHELSGQLAHQFVVDNRPGATGNIAAEALLNARPDGCTWLVAAAALASAGSVAAAPGNDPLQQFVPVTRVASVHNVLVVHPSLPVTHLASFVAFMRARPGEVGVGMAGTGSVSHLAIELLRTRVPGLQPLIVPYKGNAPAVLDLVGGEISALFATTPTVAVHLRSGRLRAVAVASLQRARVLPAVPTFHESGFPGFEAASWSGIFGRWGTGYDQVVRLQLAVAEVLKMPDIQARLAQQGAEPGGDTPEEFRAYVRAEIGKWARLARGLGPVRE